MMNQNGILERSRSYSGGWNASRPRRPQVATVLPVTKSRSEEDLTKASFEKTVVPRVYSRLKIDDLSVLKKDALIGELEKCLEELESKHDTSSHFFGVYERVEDERNELLNELDIAFQDLQEYMHRQKLAEDEKVNVEKERDELASQNEYLKSLLANQQGAEESRLSEQNRSLREQIKELEEKVHNCTDEIATLQDERLTLIASLVNLNSDQVNDVIKRKSRSNSLTSLASIGEEYQMDESFYSQVDELEEQIEKGKIDVQLAKKVFGIYKSENDDLKRQSVKMKRSRDQMERDIEHLTEELDIGKNTVIEKNADFERLKEEHKEKNLELSKLSHEKRTLQRQVDHLRENNRQSTVKIATLKKELDEAVRSSNISPLPPINESDDVSNFEEKIKQLEEHYNKQLTAKENIIEDMRIVHKNLENQIQTLKNQNATHEKEIQIGKQLRRENDELHLQRKSSVQKLEKERALVKSERSEKIELEQRFSTEVNGLQSKLDKMKKDHENYIQTLKNQFADEKLDIESNHKNELDQINSLCNDLELQKQRLTKDYDRTLKNERDRFETLNKKFEKKRGEYESLKEKVETHEQEYQNLKLSLDRLNTNHKTSQQSLHDRVSQLEIENTKLKANKEVLEKMLRDNEEEFNNLCEIKDSLEKNLLQKEDQANFRKNENSQELLESETKFANLQTDYERLLSKSKELEKNVGRMAQLFEENKALKLACEKSDKKYAKLDRDFNEVLKNKEKERENYSTLLLKYDNLCRENEKITKEHKELKINYDNLCKKYDNLYKEREKLAENCLHLQDASNNNRELFGKYESLYNERDALCQENAQLVSTTELLQREIETAKGYYVNISVKYDNLCRKHEELSHNYDSLLKENQKLVDTNYALEKEKNSQSINQVSTSSINQEAINQQIENNKSAIESYAKEKNNLQNEINTLKSELEASKSANEKIKKDYQYILQSHREEAQANLNNKQTESQQEVQTVKVKYESLRVEHEKLKKEKDYLNLNLEGVKHENEKLLIQVQKLKLCSNSTHDVTIQKLREDNDSLDKQLETYKNELVKVTAEKKSLQERLTKSDENVATTIRSLKARKTELQMQVDKLKHENEMLKKSNKTSLDSNETSKLSQETKEYAEKLQESETLLYNQQQALAKANDLAMQKCLEVTKVKRSYEKKIEKLNQDNSELRQKLYHRSLDNINNTAEKQSDKPEVLPANLNLHFDSACRKQSLPLDTLRMNHLSSPTSAFSHFEKHPRSKSVPQSPRLSNSSNSRTSLNELNRVSSGELSDFSEPHQMKISRKAELELSEQLNELLKLTDDLTSSYPKKSRDLMTSPPAPPKPPLPANYNAEQRRKSIERQNSLKNSSNKDIIQALEELEVSNQPPDNSDNTDEQWV